MQRAKEENLRVLNERVGEWTKENELPSLSQKAKSGLMAIIEHQSNRLTAQKVNLAGATISGRCFRESYPHHD